MAISSRTNPEMIVSGFVKGTREIVGKNGENAGKVLGKNVAIETAGGELQVTAWERNSISDHLARVGNRTAIVVSVDENARGANLTFERGVTDNDLELIAAITAEVLAPIK